MSTTTSFEPPTANGDAMPDIAQPRARKPENPQLLRTLNDEATPSGLSRQVLFSCAEKGTPQINTSQQRPFDTCPS